MRDNFFIVTGPSGVGKTSLLKAALHEFPQLRIAVSHTTRTRRHAEQEGVDYHFVSEAEFKQLEADGGFIETAKVFGYDYGTSHAAVKKLFAAGKGVVLEIDQQGAAQVRTQMPNQSVFILPPDKATLRTRLEGRGRDNAAEIEYRYNQAYDEMCHYHEFDSIVVNDDFDRACQMMKHIFSGNALNVEQRAHAEKVIAEMGLPAAD